MPSSKRYLVVEDQEFQRTNLVQALLSLGASVVHQASNGLEAKRILRTTGDEIDLVVTDLMMPDVDGIELLSVIREMAPSLPIILCSVDRSSLMAADAIARGSGLRVLGALTKPFTLSDLSALIAKAPSS